MHSVNIALDSYNILIGLILLFSIYSNHFIQNKLRKFFNIMVLVNILMSTADIFTMIYEGSARPINYIILPISMFVFYSCSCLVIVISGIEFILLVNQNKFRKGFYTIIGIVTAAYFVMLGITPFTDLLYSIDENNIYSRGKSFYLAFIIQVIMYLDLIVYIVINRKTLKKGHYIIIGSFVFLPQIAQIIQIAYYGISLINVGYSLTFILMFLHSNRNVEHSLENIEYELDIKESELHDKINEIENSRLQVIKMQNHTIESLSNLVENRDEDTGEHVRRTRAYVELLAVQLMKNNRFPDIMTPRYVRLLKRAAPMHDIGKIVVPDAILKKPCRLTPEEFEQIKRHASEGGRIVHEILDNYEDPEYVQITADIATHHHERWDGSGYPDNLSGKDIPLSARIMALADVFDALVSPRVYKAPMTYIEAFKIIEEGKGSHFDPVIAEEFLNIKEKVAAINESYKERANL